MIRLILNQSLALKEDTPLPPSWKKDDGSNQYTVTFESNGGTTVEPQKVSHNALATKPVEPTKAGHCFVN